MRFAGRLTKAGAYWAVEVPILNIATQGKSRTDALEMIADAVESLANRPGFQAIVYPGPEEDFEIGATDDAVLAALFLRRARARSGLTLAQAAARLGAKSINSYARYEQGRVVPTIKKLSRLYAAAGRACDFVLTESRSDSIPAPTRRTTPPAGYSGRRRNYFNPRSPTRSDQSQL